MAGEPPERWHSGWFAAVTIAGTACVVLAWYLSQMPAQPPGWVVTWFGWLRPFLTRDFLSSLLVEVGVSLALAGVLLALERKIRIYLAELVRVAFVTSSRDVRDLLADLPRDSTMVSNLEDALLSVGDLILRCGLGQISPPRAGAADAPVVRYAFSSGTRPEVRWELLEYPPDELLGHRLTVGATEVRIPEPLAAEDFVARTRDLTQELVERLRTRPPESRPTSSRGARDRRAAPRPG